MEFDNRPIAAVAALAMCLTFVTIVGGWLAVGQVQVLAESQTGTSSDGVSSQRRPPASASAAAVSGSVVRLSAGDTTTSTVGSGFILGHCVVTNHHVVANASYIQIQQSKFGVEPLLETGGSILASSATSDVALIVGGQAVLGSGVSLASESVTVGQPVTIYGYHGGETLLGVDAVIHADVDGTAYGIDGPILLLDQVVSRGMSGGPVVNSEGQVIGIVSRVDELTDLTVAIQISVLESYLDNASVKQVCTR